MPFLGAKWRDEMTRRAGLPVTIAAWNNEKTRGSTIRETSLWIFSPLLYQLSYPASRSHALNLASDPLAR